MSGRVMVGLASIPEREASLERVVDALAPQADRVVVSLNDYAAVPGFLRRHGNVEATVRRVNSGDGEKFAGVDEWDGYVVTVDDDVLYPADYVETLVAGIDRYGRDALVGFHGGKTLGWTGAPLAATHKRIRCLGALAADDEDVNVLGTGAMGYHTGRVPLWRDVFRYPNMADVHLACHARGFGIPMVALAHEEGWLSDICPPGRSIYESNRRRDGSRCDTTAHRQREMSRFDWTAPPPGRPRVRVSVATCARPHLLPALLRDLERQASWLDLQVAVYEDPTDADYSVIREQAAANGWQWHRFDERLGRDRHAELVDRQLRDCRDSAADWFVFLPDDVRLVRHALPRAIETWNRLEDPSTLTLWRLMDHEGQSNWTNLLPVDREHAFEIFHVDGIYLCGRETLEFLGYRCPPVSRVRPSRRTSSGVGRAMSLRLHSAGRRMYRVNGSLAVPLRNEPSVMNPDARDRRYPGVAL